MFRWIMDRQGGWAILAVAALLFFIAVNVGAGRIAGMRADLTQDKLFTLSPGTVNILKGQANTLALTLYYSEQLGTTAPVYGNYAARVKDMLREFESASAGKLELTIKDPKPFSETEDEAVELGMQGIPLDDTGAKVYFGLSAAAGVNKSAVPFLQIERENFLEYDIASMIRRMDSGGKSVLAVFSARPLFGDFQLQMSGLPSRPYAVVEQLQDQFDLRQIWAMEDIWKEKPDILMIVHPGQFEDEDYYHLDQYLLRGGKAMIFLDPYNESAAARQGGGFPERIASELKRLLDHWGVEMVEKRVVADRQFARMVNAGDSNRVIPAPFLTWMGVKRVGFSTEDAVTSNINLLNLQSAGILRGNRKDGLSFEPLVTSTQDSQEVDVELLQGPRPKILTILEGFEPSGKALVVAARVNGRTKTMFPDGPPPEEPEEPEEKGKPAESESGEKSDAEKPDQKSERAQDGAVTADGEDQKPDGTNDKTAPAVKSDRAERVLAQAPAAEEPAGKPAGAEGAKPEEKAAEPAAQSETGGKPPAETPANASDGAKPDETAKEGAKPEEEEVKAPPHIAESTAPMNVILVADADMLEDRAWVQTREFFGQQVRLPFANNADFVVNAIENLAGGDDLISLRSRGTAQRPFTKIEELRLAADKQFRAEERELQKKLEEAEKKLAELEERKKQGGSEAAVDKAVEATADKFTQELLETRKELRRVQLALREDIESLESWLRFINIALIPILVGVAAMILSAMRYRRRRRTVREAAAS